MSASGRGTVRDEKDFYATPRAAFAPLLNILPPTQPPNWDCDHLSGYHEPCAGDGRLIRWLRESGRTCKGSDLYPQTCEEYLPISVDYLNDTHPYQFVISNPPFGIAFEMCQHARKHSREFMFLLRLSFLESEDRGDWLSANEPAALFVLRKRPSFVMACRCKPGVYDIGQSGDKPVPMGCGHSWILPIEAARPKNCPKCGAMEPVSISTSDNSGYAWFYWGERFTGIHHI